MNKINSIQKLIDLRNQYLDILLTQSNFSFVASNRWDLPEIIAHLNNWMENDIRSITFLLNGKEPKWDNNIDSINAIGIKKRTHMTYEEVVDEFEKLSNQLIKKYQMLTREDWLKKVWKDRDLTPNQFLSDDIVHWKEHLDEIKKLLERNHFS